MAAASTGFSSYSIVNGDITIDGQAVIWDALLSPLPNSIFSRNSWADVTALVKPKIDAAPVGRVDFTVAEPNNPVSIDGEILAVIFDDPAQSTINTVILLYGAQNVAGDNFNVLLANPIDLSDPDLAVDMSLGISFGFQPSGQFSQVDVNTTRLTTSAGGQDDGVVPAFNGALITVGGLDDSNANPANPFATDISSGGDHRYDDELYDLLPFVNNGDTNINVATRNPSNDDNIFFAAFNLTSAVAIVGEGILLAPSSDTHNVGETCAKTATVQDDDGNPVVGRTVEFEVISGPNAGLTGTAVTDANGQATFSYSSLLTGTDVIVARFDDSQGQAQTSNEVQCIWEGQVVYTDPHSQGFWKTHEDAWPVSSLTIGGNVYTKAQLLQVLTTPPKGDAVLILAHQLIAAKLNIANGSNPAPVATVIADADSLLTGINLLSHSVVKSSSALGQLMVADAGILDAYNNGLV
jgi:hypothetical protein